MRTDLFNNRAEKVGTVELPEGIFGARWNADLVHQAVTVERASGRAPIAHTKDRSEVRGGGRKPWKQKHTGRARHGSTRSPLWSGGGTTFGPRSDRDFSRTISKKMKRAALCAVLSRKLKDGEVRVVDDFKLAAPKTKEVAAMLARFLTRKGQTALLVPARGNPAPFRAGRNLAGTAVVDPTSLSVYTLLSHRHVLVEAKAVADLAPAKKT